MSPENTTQEKMQNSKHTRVTQQALLQALEKDGKLFSDRDVEAIFDVVSEVSDIPTINTSETRERITNIRDGMHQLIENNGALVKSMLVEWAMKMCDKIDQLLNEPSPETKALNNSILNEINRLKKKPVVLMNRIIRLLDSDKDAVHSSTIELIMLNIDRIITYTARKKHIVNIQQVNYFMTKLAQFSNFQNGNFTGSQIANCIKGLENLCDEFCDNPFLVSMAYKLEITTPENFTWNDIKNIFIGLKNVSTEKIPRRIMQNLADISDVLALKHLPAPEKVLIALMETIAELDPIIEIPSKLFENVSLALGFNTNLVLSGESFRKILIGLRNQPLHQGYRLLVNQVASKISKHPDNEYTCDHIGGAFYGLKHQNDETYSGELFKNVALKLYQSDSNLTNYSLINIFQGISKISDRSIPPEFYTELRKKIEKSKIKLDSETIGCFFLSIKYKDVRTIPPSYLEQMLAEIAEFSGEILIGTIIHGIGACKVLKNRKYYTFVEQFVLDNLEHFKGIELDEIEVISLIRALNLSELAVPSWLMDEYSRVLGEIDKDPNRLEEFVYTYFKTLHPDLKVKVNYHFKGFEMDIFIKEFNINIELDGLHHKIHPDKDRERDYFLKKKGIRVIRIDLNEIDFDAQKLQEKLEEIDL